MELLPLKVLQVHKALQVPKVHKEQPEQVHKAQTVHREQLEQVHKAQTVHREQLEQVHKVLLVFLVVMDRKALQVAKVFKAQVVVVADLLETLHSVFLAKWTLMILVQLLLYLE
jgi:uridylate kinase